MRLWVALDSRRRAALLGLAALTAGANAPVTAEGWQPISPGATDRVVEITETCPTFSWSAPGKAPRPQSRVTIAVVHVTSGGSRRAKGGRDAVVLAASLPGGARSWTPSAEQCLEPGRSYRWFVVEDDGIADGRITNAQVVGNEGNVFAISALPSEVEIAWARDVLRRHLGDAAPVSAAEAAIGRPAEGRREGRGSETRALAQGTVAVVGSDAPVESTFSGEAAVAIQGAVHVSGLHAVKTASSSGDILAEGPIISPQSPILGNGITFTDASGNSQIVVSQPSLNFDMEVEGWLAAGTLDATTIVRATSVQVPPGSLTGDDGGVGVEYVDQKSCGFLGLDDCIRVDENNTFCFGGSFVVAARLWQTDADQIGVQVKCTDPLPESNP